MQLALLNLLDLIRGMSPAQINIVMPDESVNRDISQAFSVDSRVKRKRRALWRDAWLALRRGHGERMRNQLLQKLAEAKLARGIYAET